MRGKGEARTLGYPTANIDYQSAQPPEAGVWLCYVVFEEKKLPGLAVIDMWKLPNGLPSIEVHILDFDRDLYGEKIEVNLISKLRDLQKFTGVEKLIERIKEDINVAQIVWAQIER